MPVHCKDTPQIFIGLPWQFTSTHLYSWVESDSLHSMKHQGVHVLLLLSECQSIARILPRFLSGFPGNLPVLICTPGWRVTVSIAWSTKEYMCYYSSVNASPLQGYSPDFYRASLAIYQYSFVLLGGEWHCDERWRVLLKNITQWPARSQTQTSYSKVQRTDH